MGPEQGGDLYTGDLISMLEVVWGEGWLSPGGPEEVARLIDGIDFRGRQVLDIGCGVGGIDFYLVEAQHAGHVTGIDVEATVIETATARAAGRGLADRTSFIRVFLGPLGCPDGAFDIVFSKDAIVHVPDKHALMSDIFRVLEPGGWFVASDWLICSDGPPSIAMAAYIEAEGLGFGMASPARYLDAMTKAGFIDIRIENRNAWYRETARKELLSMRGELYDEAVARLGKAFVDHNVDIWEKMLAVLDTGEHCPHHLRGRKPA
jgi:phosphoethanolamine N-methyltransferase